MLPETERKFLLSVLSAPRRAHNTKAHSMADKMLAAEVIDLARQGSAAQRDLAVKLAALPQLLSGEVLGSAVIAGQILEAEVLKIDRDSGFSRRPGMQPKKSA
jgi:hypothetical protein